MATGRLRQTREEPILSRFRRVYPGEVEGELAHRELVKGPEVIWDSDTILACDEIFCRYVTTQDGGQIPDAAFCDLPRWVFLEYAVRFGGALLHGTNDMHRTELRAERLSINVVGWDRPCHFASSSTMNAMFNAVHDRAMLKRLDCSLKSSTTQPDPGDESSGERFYFGLDYRAMPHGPWCSGTVYLYRASEFPDKSAKTPFYSSKPIHPIAKVNVRPQDWPLLDKVQGVDPVAQTVRQWDTYKGFPWRDDPTIHPNLRFGHLVEGTRRHIRAAYTEQIGLEQLGKMADLSPFAMLRMFRAHTGLSPHDYQSQLRIASAKSLLGKGRPIGEVGIETGYSDQSHFTRCFRREVGLTPGEYVRVQESSICSR